MHAAIAVPARRPRALTDPAVRRAQQGDADAFGQVYRDHAGRVYALCLRMSGDTVAARELTQDVFVQAWEKLPGFRGAAAFGTWLHRLAVNVVLMRWRTDGGIITTSPACTSCGGRSPISMRPTPSRIT